ncbi:MAG: helix-turn-helix domain-containing protein [Alphaproteobacteria bacterium]|nr:helix-turn-helix domain-containing protein [Alphaproteobacteria bacterium]
MASIATEHVQRIEAALSGSPKALCRDGISSSWRRSFDRFHIDPASKEELHVLPFPELSALREQSQLFVNAAQPELDRLYQIVRPARYVVLLTDQDGVVIDHRGAEEDAEQFRQWGLWLGRVWSETVEGTNGIGTALVDGRPTTVHRQQHFRVRHTSLSCSGAPIRDPDGKLLGVVDISSFDPKISDRAHSMTEPLIVAVARGIEERLFRARYPRHWVITTARADRPDHAMLLAVDEDRRIVGTSHGARRAIEKTGHDLANGLSLWDLFERNDVLFRRRNNGDTAGSLTCREDGIPLATIVTPPLPAYMGKFRLEPDSLLWRPRADALLSGHGPATADPHLGLTPAAMRRINDHIDAHLDGDLSVKSLATVAGLSESHFIRAFKVAEGVTPHAFVLERRLAKARRLLIKSSLPLSEIAAAVGFADQSHLARRFRQRIGVSPSEFRKSQAG